MSPDDLFLPLREAYPGQRIEVILSPGIPPSRDTVSIRFTTLDEFKAALVTPEHKAKPVGNGELVQIYLKQFRTPQGVKFCADFASDPGATTHVQATNEAEVPAQAASQETSGTDAQGQA